MSSLGMTLQQYVALSALLTEPSGCRTPILKPKMRSRKGSITQTKSYEAELLPCGGILN